jgi:fluoride exporter
MTPTISLREYSMFKVLLVGAGGFIGSILRYLIGGYVQQLARGAGFPFGTLLVNVAGCLIIGFLSRLAEGQVVFTGEARAFIIIGLLGGFTTFSSFGYEAVDLWRGEKEFIAIVNVASHLILGLSAIWLGRVLAHPIR